MRLTIQIKPAVVGAVALWALAVALMVWDVADGANIAEKGRWAILVGIAAGTWTVALITRHCRRVILEVMSREHLLQMMREDPDGEHRATVRALR